MASKDIMTLSQWLQCIVLYINQNSKHILYKPGLDLYIADWLSYHNPTENRDQEIAGVSISILRISTAVDIPVCISIEDIRAATGEDTEL